MPGDIFINYRRDDAAADARSVRDALVAKLGKSAVFMDIDGLVVGKKYDGELAAALGNCKVFLAIIGPRWLEMLNERAGGRERDYVREEIFSAITSGIPVVPVYVGRRGTIPAHLQRNDLPSDLGELADFQACNVTHESFGRDIAEVIAGVEGLLKPVSGGYRAHPWRYVGAMAVAVLSIGGIGAHFSGGLNFGANVEGKGKQVAPDEPPQARRANVDTAAGARVAAAEADQSRATKAASLAARINEHIVDARLTHADGLRLDPNALLDGKPETSWARVPWGQHVVLDVAFKSVCSLSEIAYRPAPGTPPAMYPRSISVGFAGMAPIVWTILQDPVRQALALDNVSTGQIRITFLSSYAGEFSVGELEFVGKCS